MSSPTAMPRATLTNSHSDDIGTLKNGVAPAFPAPLGASGLLCWVGLSVDLN